MKIGDRVFISGEIYYNKAWIEVISKGTIKHAGLDACLVNIDFINGDTNVCVIIKNKYIHDRKGVC